MIVVSDTSPITNLAAIGQLDLLRQLYSQVIIPQAVFDEMAGLDYEVPGTQEVQTLSWIQVQPVTNSVQVEELSQEIDLGEAEAIVLAIELGANRLLIDDHRGRVAALRLGLNITGILGVLVAAKQRNYVEAVKGINILKTPNY